MGIGLTMCKHIIEEIGGDIRVESEVGKGSIFTFTFPITEIIPSEDMTTIDNILHTSLNQSHISHRSIPFESFTPKHVNYSLINSYLDYI